MSAAAAARPHRLPPPRQPAARGPRARWSGRYCAAIALAALLTEHPLLLGSLLATVLAAGARAGQRAAAAAGPAPQRAAAARPQRGRQPARQPPGPDGVRPARRLGRAGAGQPDPRGARLRASCSRCGCWSSGSPVCWRCAPPTPTSCSAPGAPEPARRPQRHPRPAPGAGAGRRRRPPRRGPALPARGERPQARPPASGSPSSGPPSPGPSSAPSTWRPSWRCAATPLPPGTAQARPPLASRPRLRRRGERDRAAGGGGRPRGWRRLPRLSARERALDPAVVALALAIPAIALAPFLDRQGIEP